MKSVPQSRHPQVGAPDASLERSPTVGDHEPAEVEPLVPEGCDVCKGVSYAIGDFIVSGSELLRCQSPGVWVRKGEWRPRAGAPR